MIHPLLRLAATRPELLAEHAQGYAELVGAELACTLRTLRRRTVYASLGLALLGIGATLGGVAVLLWAVTPPGDLQSPWAMVAVPALPLVVGAWCLMQARAGVLGEGLDTVREQLAADMALLREAGRA